ncbi:hypothetical protein E5288_WYG015877 [Bos mutus]|uniref:Uncharacterized protein n=1 Tax=Bos mutus TaxID=72004 RepID=A0A6B0RJV2_9CETA|nr:hypothetical protein [Bos mutus]
MEQNVPTFLRHGKPAATVTFSAKQKEKFIHSCIWSRQPLDIFWTVYQDWVHSGYVRGEKRSLDFLLEKFSLQNSPKGSSLNVVRPSLSTAGYIGCGFLTQDEEERKRDLISVPINHANRRLCEKRSYWASQFAPALMIPRPLRKGHTAHQPVRVSQMCSWCATKTSSEEKTPPSKEEKRHRNSQGTAERDNSYVSRSHQSSEESFHTELHFVRLPQNPVAKQDLNLLNIDSSSARQKRSSVNNASLLSIIDTMLMGLKLPLLGPRHEPLFFPDQYRKVMVRERMCNGAVLGGSTEKKKKRNRRSSDILLMTP